MANKYSMPVGTCNFQKTTLFKLERFEIGKKELKRIHPELPLSQVRAYLRGEGELPDEETIYVVERMREDRTNAIKHQMHFVQIEAKSNGETVPERYLTGEALDVYFAPDCYRYYGFWVYSFLSWYEPWEEAELLSGPLFSM